MLIAMQKYTVRVVVGVLIYLFYRVTTQEFNHSIIEWTLESGFYLLYTLASVLLVWEIASRSVQYFKKSLEGQGNPFFIIRKMAIWVVLVTFPVVIFALYVHSYFIIPLLKTHTGSQDRYFLVMVTQAMVLTMLIAAYEIVLVYTRLMVKYTEERLLMEKELHKARFESLKNQINPHFLFNSFSVLTSLISEDPKMAEAFVTSLSRMYRYILDHKDDKMASLQEEMRFLNQYIFLLKIRHEEGIKITNRISLAEEKIMLPSLSLQMLVENAVKHNAFTQEEPLEITLYNEESDWIVVRNRLRLRNTPADSTGTGLINLRKRYQLSMSEDIIIKTDEEYYTVKLPIKKYSA